MAAVRKSNFDWNGKPFWGLVQQNGPWASTPDDRKRASMKDIATIGGGIGAGGRAHAGNANFTQVMTPTQINATGAPPLPSGYAMRSVMMGPVDMKRKTKMGKVKTGLTLGARASEQTGHKMGNIKMENSTQTEPGDIMGPVRTEGTTTFGSTHHIMEMPNLITGSDYDTTSEGAENNILSFGGTPIRQNRVPTIDQHVPFADQMVAATTARDAERVDVMGRQIETIYQQAVQEQLPTEMRATTSLPDKKGKALKHTAGRVGNALNMLAEKAKTGPETAPQKLESRSETAKRFRAGLNYLKQLPKNAPKRYTNRPTQIDTIGGRQKFSYKGRQGENLIGARYGTGRNPKNTAPGTSNTLYVNGPAQNTRTKKPEMKQVSGLNLFM